MVISGPQDTGVQNMSLSIIYVYNPYTSYTFLICYMFSCLYTYDASPSRSSEDMFQPGVPNWKPVGGCCPRKKGENDLSHVVA